MACCVHRGVFRYGFVDIDKGNLTTTVTMMGIVNFLRVFSRALSLLEISENSIMVLVKVDFPH